MKRTTHIITGLNVGGAETMLYKLLVHSDRDSHRPTVISLTDIGPIGKRIQNLEIPVFAVGMHPGSPNPLLLFRLVRLLKESNPCLVQTWMYHANFLGSIAARLVHPTLPVVWNIRQSRVDRLGLKRSTFLVSKVSALFLSWIPAKIIVNSERGKETHADFGYPASKMIVVPNGFDLDVFRKDAKARARIRQELGIPESAFLIGLVARFDPQKDHATFIEAAKTFVQAFPDTHFLLAGTDIVWENEKLAAWIREAKLEGQAHLLGRRDDIPQITAALDIATSSSLGEGFPNVVGEAMACEVPCVATAAGDTQEIIGDTGVVVDIGDAKGIADGWARIRQMSEQELQALGRRARERLISRFSIGAIAKRYQRLYEEICGVT